jgi:hypothetical protein
MGRNPKTGAKVPIFPRRVAVFKASAIMKRKIQNNRKSGGETMGPELTSAVQTMRSRG